MRVVSTMAIEANGQHGHSVCISFITVFVVAEHVRFEGDLLDLK